MDETGELHSKPILEISDTNVAGTEGEIVSNKGLAEYCHFLRFKPEALEGQRILNFGSGGTHIGAELHQKRIQADVFDLDLLFDPEDQDATTAWLFAGIRLAETHVRHNSQFRNRLTEIRRKLAGTTGRNFIQATGTALPFADKEFDTVLAHYSTYQVPDAAKPDVFSELIRVGNAFHFAPVFGKDFKVLSELTTEKGLEIIACRPLPNFLFTREKFMVENPRSYQEYVDTVAYEERVIPPKKEAPRITRIMGKAINANVDGSSFIVLRRKS